MLLHAKLPGYLSNFYWVQHPTWTPVTDGRCTETKIFFHFPITLYDLYILYMYMYVHLILFTGSS